MKRGITNTVIDAEADIRYKKYKGLQVAADRAKKDLLEYMAILPAGHTCSFCSFVQEGTTIDREQLGLYGMKYSIEVPMKQTIDWKQYEQNVKGTMEAFEQLELYKVKKAHIRGMK